MAIKGDPGHDFPEERAIIDLLVASRGQALVSWVEEVRAQDLLVTAGQDRSQRRVPLDLGEHVELVWKSPSELRSMPAELIATEDRGQPCWLLRPTGPASRGQRRAAVRAPLDLAVRVSAGNTELTGVTLDVSEGGCRAVFQPPADAASVAPSGGPAPVGTTHTDGAAADGTQADGESPLDALFGVGAVLDVTVDLDTAQLHTKGEVMRRHGREDGLRELSVRFIGMTEHKEDKVRARVFAGLRELRARGVI